MSTIRLNYIPQIILKILIYAAALNLALLLLVLKSGSKFTVLKKNQSR